MDTDTLSDDFPQKRERKTIVCPRMRGGQKELGGRERRGDFKKGKTSNNGNSKIVTGYGNREEEKHVENMGSSLRVSNLVREK